MPVCPFPIKPREASFFTLFTLFIFEAFTLKLDFFLSPDSQRVFDEFLVGPLFASVVRDMCQPPPLCLMLTPPSAVSVDRCKKRSAAPFLFLSDFFPHAQGGPPRPQPFFRDSPIFFPLTAFLLEGSMNAFFFLPPPWPCFVSLAMRHFMKARRYQSNPLCTVSSYPEAP